MSIGAAVTSFEHDGRKVNMIDTPGEPSFVADTLAALRVVDAAVFVVNAVMGVEVHTDRLWRRADEEGLARLVFVNMLDRERADFFRCLESLKAAFGQHVVATEIPIGSEHEVRGVIDLIDMTAFEYAGDGRGNAKQIEIPEELRGAGRGVPREADGRGRRELRRADGALPRGRGDLPRRRSSRRSRRGSPRATCSRSPAGSRPATSAPTGCSRRWWRTCRRRRCAARSRRSTPTASRSRSSPTRTASLLAFVVQDHRRSLHRADQHAAGLLRRACAPTRTSLNVDPAREGADRPALGARGQGDAADRRARPGRHRRGREAARDPRRRRAGGEGDAGRTSRRSTCRRR